MWVSHPQAQAVHTDWEEPKATNHVVPYLFVIKMRGLQMMAAAARPQEAAGIDLRAGSVLATAITKNIVGAAVFALSSALTSSGTGLIPGIGIVVILAGGEPGRCPSAEGRTGLRAGRPRTPRANSSANSEHVSA